MNQKYRIDRDRGKKESLRNIDTKFVMARIKYEKFAISKNWIIDHDKLDFRACCDLLKDNKQFKVEQALRKNSPDLIDRHRNIDAYIKTTVKNAYNKVRYENKKTRGRDRKTTSRLVL